MKKIAIIYKTIPQYRKEFFEKLRQDLKNHGIELVLIYGQPFGSDKTKMDTVDLKWAIKIENRVFKVFGKKLYWQPAFKHISNCDLVIFEQASKLIINYLLILRYRLSGKRVAYWGHGKNYQSHNASKLGEWIKKKIIRQVWWWFTYNELGSQEVIKSGFPRERITPVMNSIDTKQLIALSKQITTEEINLEKEKLNIDSSNIAIYAGGLYEEKRIDFLIQSSILIREKLPDFTLIIIGSGDEKDKIEIYAEEYKWIKYLGPKFGREKVKYFKMSKLLLMPGLVGLGILDSFALKTPIVTTDLPYHSPEIEYLKNNENGIIVSESYSEYAYSEAVIELLSDYDKLKILNKGCKESRSMYTIENMVENFRNGVIGALK